ncbi:hypothetical protein K4K54_004710, partial [Colletotrichum sp. SAR 10_86]
MLLLRDESCVNPYVFVASGRYQFIDQGRIALCLDPAKQGSQLFSFRVVPPVDKSQVEESKGIKASRCRLGSGGPTFGGAT